MTSHTDTYLADALPPRALRKPGVTTREAGWLLSLGETAVRRLIRRGELVHAVAPTLISATSLHACLPDDAFRRLREVAIDAVIDDRLRVPAPQRRYAPPAPITEFARYLDASTGTRTVRSFPAAS